METAIFVAMTSRLAGSIAQPAADVTSAAGVGITHSQQDHSIILRGLVHWHLLSLDAPTVAVLWTVFIAVITHTKLPAAIPLATALIVWALYASDRLLDTKHLGSTRQKDTLADLEPRHFFHHRYRKAFMTSIMICTIAVAALVPLLPPPAIRLYLAEAALMTGYFFLIHAAPHLVADTRVSQFFFTSTLPKELLVGPFFAAAVFIPITSGRPELRMELFPLAILFAALCSLNCLYIYAWEHPTSYRSHWATSYSVRNLKEVTSLFLAASLLCFAALAGIVHVDFSFQLYPIACALSALLLFAIHTQRERLSPSALRAAADGALLTPLLILPFLF